MARTRSKEKTTAGSIIELVVIVAVALGLALGIQAFLVKPYRIPSESMVPTLEVGAGRRVEHDDVADLDVCGDRNHDDTAACDRPTPGKAKVNFIKRVVAGPGDTIRIIDGHVIRNGKREKDSYIANGCAGNPKPGCNLPTPITIPPGHWFMMGDNRGDSDDSRFWGPVPTTSIIGGAFATYWPPNRIGLL